MPDEDLVDDQPRGGTPASKIRYAREVASAAFQLVVVLPLIALGAIALVALALSPLVLYFWFLYRELGLVGAIAMYVLIVSVLRLLTIYSQRRSRPRP